MRKPTPSTFILILLLLLYNSPCSSQSFLAGADLSYTNSVLENGGIYRDTEGNEIDPNALFAQKGAKIIRIRLWHTPENITDHCGNPVSTDNLNDVVLAFQRAKAQGTQLMLAIHYGDYFNDPDCQKRPAAWDGLPHSILLDSIYNYTYAVLDRLNAEDVLPYIVAIGNETTWGFVDETGTTNGWTWPQDAEKFNSALDAVDDFNNAHSLTIRKALHFTDGTAAWLAGLFQDNGITNYDMIGISYYPVWTEKTLAQLGQLVTQLASTYNKEIMIFETGAVWTTAAGDSYSNFMNGYGMLDYEISPQGQKTFLIDLANEVYSNGGKGIIYWEPGWISSGMCDKWGQGSSYENVSFFDFNNNNAALPAFDFFSYCNTLSVGPDQQPGEFSIYPNPFSYKTIIQTKLPFNNSTLTIVNSLGKTVRQINNLSGQTIELQKDGLGPGIYFLRILINERTTVSGKLVITD